MLLVSCWSAQQLQTKTSVTYRDSYICFFSTWLLVNDDVGVAILLGDHAKRAEVKNVEEVFDDKLIGGKKEEDPLSICIKEMIASRRKARCLVADFWEPRI